MTAPAIAGVVFVPGPAMYGFLAVAAVALSIPFSLHVTLGQDYLPSRIGTADGMTLGLAVSVGGLASPLLGAIAEHGSLQLALSSLIGLALASWLIGYSLAEPASPEFVRSSTTLGETANA